MSNNVPWRIKMSLAPKPHQEHIINIKYFIWRMCVSNCGVRKFTQGSKYQIICCNDMIHIIGVFASNIYIITVDTKQVYHQISVYALDRDNLELFAPNNRKYTYRVYLLGLWILQDFTLLCCKISAANGISSSSVLLTAWTKLDYRK